MITIIIAEHPSGADVATASVDDREYRAISHNGASMVLCRDLFAALVPDQPWEMVGSDGRLRMSGPSIYEWAKYMITEPDRGALQMRRWRPMEGDLVCVPCGTGDHLYKGRCLACGQKWTGVPTETQKRRSRPPPRPRPRPPGAE